MEKRHIFLDSNVFYYYQEKLSNKVKNKRKDELTEKDKDETLKEFRDFLYFNFWDDNQNKYKGCSIPDYIAIELKTNREKDFSFLFKYVEVSITNILLCNESILVAKEEQIKKAEFSLEQKQKIFSNQEMIKNNNYETYQDFKIKIHLLEFRYIFGFIIKIYEEYFGIDFLDTFNEKVHQFVLDYVELNKKGDKERRVNKLINEISSKISDEEYKKLLNNKVFLRRVYKEEYERIISQAKNKKDKEALSYGMVLKLNFINKMIENKNFKGKTNNLFDTYFMFCYENNIDILTGDIKMCKRFKRLLNAEKVDEIQGFEVLRIKKPDETYSYFSDVVYKKIME
jgi:hypothetical protein|nr:MAG TPA: hypothetical protein [Caudoviricetes sp.]